MNDTVYRGNDWDDVRPHLWNFFQAGEVAQAGHRGRGFRQPRRDRLPHGERIVLPQEAGLLGTRASHSIKS